MKRMNVLFALMLGVLVSFTACDSDDDLTPEEQEAKQKEELIETIEGNFNSIVSKKWIMKEFQPSAQMEAASKTQDGYDALSTITFANGAKSLNMNLTISADGDDFKPTVDFELEGDALKEKVLEILNAPYVEMGFIMYPDLTEKELNSYLAQYRRVIASPFAADDLKTDQITNEETGRCIFSITMTDYSSLAYDDVVLGQKKLIAGNTDKIYLNEDGTLTVESTDEKYGVSKIILEEVTE